MNYAHMIGEHTYDSRVEQVTHVLTSWAGFVVAVILCVGIVALVVRAHRKSAKQKVEK